MSGESRLAVSLGAGLPEIVLLRPDDQEALLVDAIARRSPELPDAGAPYWAEVWPAARPLARFLLETRPFSPGERVLELGCGLGLVGLALAKAGARVALTDGSPRALEIVRRELDLNSPFPHEPVVARLDWEKFDIEALGGAFPLVVGADVLYEPASFSALAKAARASLAPSGKLLLAEPQRKVARSAREHLEREGLVLAERTEVEGGVVVQRWV